MDISNEPTAADRLLPLNSAIRELIPGKKLSPSLTWRWATKGLMGLNSERIRLQIWYVGREPHTTHAAIRQFLDAVTAARLEKMRRTQQRTDDVTEAELNAAGLLSKRN